MVCGAAAFVCGGEKARRYQGGEFGCVTMAGGELVAIVSKWVFCENLASTVCWADNGDTSVPHFLLGCFGGGNSR